ncbi:unnamed protein product, partial [Laminaria digitata]
FTNLASAQVGTCEPALGQGILDTGNVRASIYNNGGLFWRGGAPVYQIPKDGDVSAIFAATIWVGGLIEGELRTAATNYGNWEFWAGPLDENGNPPALCKPYDKVWKISKEDITSFLTTGYTSNNLKNWPWHLGAPVVDGDGDPDNYNLQGGDVPELFGDQRLWWVMNDRGNVHERTETEPIGLEAQGSVHAFNHRGFGGNITFYSYELINKNTAPLTDAYFGLFTDIDLGNFDDDYVGSDSLLHLGYAYNSDNEDEGGYGEAPPAIGFTFFETILADLDGLDNDYDGVFDEPGEKMGASSVMEFYGGGGVTGDPNAASDFYNYMQALWKDGQPVTLGGYGRHFSNTPTKFSFSGDPVTRSFWSEFNSDGNRSPTGRGDRDLLTSTGPFSITSGDTLNIRFAIVWSQGKDHLDSVTRLKGDVRILQVNPSAYYTPFSQMEEESVVDPTFVLSFAPNFPNPFAGSTTLRYSLPQSMQVRLAVYDILGREVEVLVDQQQEAGIYTVNFEADALPSGIYMARIE